MRHACTGFSLWVALASLGMGTHEVLHVRDSMTSDVAGAAVLGIPVAWVNREGKAAPIGSGPDHEVAELAELARLIS